MTIRKKKSIQRVLMGSLLISLLGISPVYAEEFQPVPVNEKILTSSEVERSVVTDSLPAQSVVTDSLPAQSVVTDPVRSVDSWMNSNPGANRSSAQPSSIRDVLSWVCKTIITVVGIAVWLPTVVTTGGVTTVILTLVVRYLSVPVLACAWI